MASATGSAAISFHAMVSYRERRRCSGATFPVRFWNRHGGSASTVPNGAPSRPSNPDTGPVCPLTVE